MRLIAFVIGLLLAALLLDCLAVQAVNTVISQPESGTTYRVVEDTEIHFAPTMFVSEHGKMGDLRQGMVVEVSCHHTRVENEVATAEYDMFWRLWYRVKTDTVTGGGWVLARSLKKIR